ncbi:hypothetical protein CVD28_16750 [Bacillus sp. M6-12]|uniref:polysaccharide deacetylase family protein n=1 Tax=Bacillus sp. M6-12 TaxID=2054166 RepID=UPI000C771139|nr:polysaccharide deacetylase family protein [Bacillus sp. M6-12]PLS16724.1 hypothetical protein CVD28_16750 [Bacillus sp. M6-12]
MNEKWRRFIAVPAIAAVSYALVQSPFVEQYITEIKDRPMEAASQKDPLFAEINSKAKEYEQAPTDARIDPVWKTIPGHNGLKVDIEASYKKMKPDGLFDEKKLIYKQVSPKVHIKDLKPAPIYKANPEKPAVSFLINVAWGNEYLQEMLETLKKHEVKATFFLEGRWAKNNPVLAEMIAEGGHEIGNHSYSHPLMENISAGKTREEIIKTNEAIEAVTGVKCKWFAPPSGSFRDETVDIAHSLNLGTILWSVDTIDWQKPTPEVLTKRVLDKVHPGAFVLMHPTESTSRSLEILITNIKKKNLHIVTVSEAVSEERIMH